MLHVFVILLVSSSFFAREKAHPDHVFIGFSMPFMFESMVGLVFFLILRAVLLSRAREKAPSHSSFPKKQSKNMEKIWKTLKTLNNLENPRKTKQKARKTLKMSSLDELVREKRGSWSRPLIK